MNPPYDDPTPLAWLAFLDHESEQAQPRYGVLRAARVALGLLRRPKMVLVALGWHLNDDATRTMRTWKPIVRGDEEEYEEVRWWTESYVRGRLSFPGRVGLYLATPLDFDMPDDLRAPLCVSFCQKAARVPGRLELRGGVIWEERRVGGVPYMATPVDWAKEKARCPHLS